MTFDPNLHAVVKVNLGHDGNDPGSHVPGGCELGAEDEQERREEGEKLEMQGRVNSRGNHFQDLEAVHYRLGRAQLILCWEGVWRGEITRLVGYIWEGTLVG